jgi:AT-rich interactive domain-containing protein 2
LRSQYGLFNDFVRRNEFEKLELALLCGFPNELTFTLNTLLLLSSSSSHSKSFHLYKCPRLLDLLYRHIGLFSSSDILPNDQSLKILYENIWSKHLNYHLEQFWIDSCSPKILKLILNIDFENPEKDFYQNFNLNSNENSQQQEFRIEQILMIIRNLSFDRLNALYLLDTIRSPSSITYQFLLLISYCEKKIELQKYAYDIWTNLALYMHLRLISNDEGLLFRELLNNMLNDGDREQQDDRLKIIRALEIISNLAHAGNDNGIYLIDYINIMIENFLHIPDILILVHTLECLYQLSELGEQLCDAILNVQSSTSVITTLIDLLTIEARSFSSQTIKTIKIVEMSTGPVLLPSYHQPPPTIAPQSVVVISANQPTQPPPQYLRPLTITGVNPPTNLLSVTTSSTMLTNSNDKKRKHDCKLFLFCFISRIKNSCFSHFRNYCCCCEWYFITVQTSSSNSIIKKAFRNSLNISRR